MMYSACTKLTYNACFHLGLSYANISSTRGAVLAGQ
jgi:hypothetical protein